MSARHPPCPTSASRWPGRGALRARYRPLRPCRRASALLLIGPSGSGKSTFLSLHLRHHRRRSRGVSTSSAPTSPACRRRRATPFRAEHFGIIFQMFNLLPYGTVHRQRAAAAELRAAGVAGAPRPRGLAKQEAARLLTARPRGPPRRATIRPPTSSVGQQQRSRRRPRADRLAGADRGR